MANTPEARNAALLKRFGGVEAKAECGCRGTWQVRGETVWWVPADLCATHQHLHWQDPVQFPPLKAPPPELSVAIRAAGWGADVWPLPCKLCGAATHEAHAALCVFWDVNERTPF